MEDKKITHVRVHFQGTPKGKRKIDFQSEAIDKLENHTLLTPEQATNYERKVWELLDAKQYKNISRCELVTNFGWDKGIGIISMELLPKQRIAIVRSN